MDLAGRGRHRRRRGPGGVVAVLRLLLALALVATSYAQGIQIGRTGTVSITTDPDTAAVDSFGRWRVAPPVTEFDSKEVGRASTRFWSEDTAGAGSIVYDADESSHALTVGTASGDRATRQTKQFFAYQPGKSRQVLATGVLGAGKAGVASRIGQFDDGDGLFFEVADGVLRFVRRTSVSGSAVDNVIARSTWADPLDGTGASGYTIDLDSAQIFFLQYQWLGVGRIQWGVSDNGRTIVAGTYKATNVLDTVYMRTATLPVRYEIENTGTVASGTTLTQICSTVVSEGGYAPRGVRQAAHTGNTTIGSITAGTLTPLLSVRLDSADIRSQIVPDGYQISTSGSGDYRVEVILGGTLTGASWSDVSADSIAEEDTSSTAITGGTRIAAEYVTGGSGSSVERTGDALSSDLTVAADYAGVSDVLTLAIYPISNTTVTGATLRWREVR